MVAAVLSMLLMITPVNATTPVAISGTFVGTSFPVNGPIRYAGANVFMSASNEGLYVSGPIIGAFEQTTQLIWHFGNPQTVKDLPSNTMLWKNIESFAVWHIERTFTGTVDNKEGTLTMLLEAKFTYPTVTYPSLEGTWIIISETGDLANLRGEGTWWNSPGQILEYEGQIHFNS